MRCPESAYLQLSLFVAHIPVSPSFFLLCRSRLTCLFFLPFFSDWRNGHDMVLKGLRVRSRGASCDGIAHEDRGKLYPSPIMCCTQLSKRVLRTVRHVLRLSPLKGCDVHRLPLTQIRLCRMSAERPKVVWTPEPVYRLMYG